MTTMSLARKALGSILTLVCLALLAAPLSAQVAIDGNANPRIMPLGDSITAGYSLAVGGYRAELGSRLQSAGLAFTYVGGQGTYNPNGSSGLSHEGHSGWNTPQITAIVNGSFSLNSTSANQIMTTANPDIVLLMIGTNDMIGSSSTLNTDYDTLLSAIFAQKSTVRVIVFPMIYCSVFSDVQADNVTYGGRNIQYLNGQNIVTNRFMTGLVHTITGYQQAGRRITFFDGMTSVVTPANCHDATVLVDGVHPTATTYQAMGDAVVRAIQDVTPGAIPGTVVPTAPSGLKSAVNGNGFNLTWTTNSLNETGFLIEATVDPLFQSNIVSTSASAGSNSATVGGLQANTVYYLRVSATNGAGNSPKSFPIQATTGNGSTSQVSTPTFSPSPGTYTGTQSVTISSATSGATIFYTLDGGTPSAASTNYTGAINVVATTTLKAIAIKSGATDSSVATALYTIQSGNGGLLAPIDFAASAVASTQINLTWTNQGNAATAIRIDRDTDPGFPNPITVDVAAAADSLKVAKLLPSTTYYFRLRAVQGSNISGPVIANATTQASIQLIMVGDSITAGFSYPAINKGIAGDQSPSALDRFFTDVNIYRPRLVTIMIGTNDIANGIPAATTQANISAMINTAVTAGIGVILGTIPPAGNTTSRLDATIDSMNAWIADTVNQNNLTLADYHAALWPYDSANYADGLHPNNVGYGKMSPVLDSAVQAAVSKLTNGSYGAAPADEAAPVTGTLLTGTAFGRDGTVGLAFDGNITTLYESSGGNNGSGGYVGLDLGAGNARRIAGVRCYPRSDALFTRAFGGRFQGSNSSATTGFVDLAAITLVPVQSRWEMIGVADPVAYRWVRYYGQTGGLCSISEVQFVDGGIGTTQQPVTTPIFSPAGGSFSTAQTVSISSSTAGASIRYTTDGSTPTGSSPLYGGALTVSMTTTIKALAQKSGVSDSSVSSATYTITPVVSTVSTPSFSPAGGTFASAQSVSLSTATAGATIHYTTDGSTPTGSSPLYGGAIAVGSTTTIKALAQKTGMNDSAVISATFTITPGASAVTMPTFSPSGGSYATAQSVAISTATAGATIRYTTDGSTPTGSSPLYAGAIAVSSSLTIQALAQKSGMTDSPVAVASYTITSGTTPPAAAAPAASSHHCGAGSGLAVLALLSFMLVRAIGFCRLRVRR